MNKTHLNTYNTKRNDYLSLFLIVLNISFFFAPIYLSTLFKEPYILVILFFWFSLFSNGIINLMHESAHRLIFKKRTFCDFFGQWVLGPLLFTDFDSYRDRHWVHHNKFGTDEDTKENYLKNIKGKKLFLIFIECIFLKHALIKFLKSIEHWQDKNFKSSKRVVIVQLFFFSTLVLFNFFFESDLKMILVRSFFSYSIIYIYGLASLGVFISILRAIAEHQVLESSPNIIGKGTLRNLKCNFLTGMIFGSYGFSEHATHHKYPSIPYYNLVVATDFFRRENKLLEYGSGYIQTLIQLCKR